MYCDFKGIILQPISKIKTPWFDYDVSKNFLNFFQSRQKDDVGNEFCVNYETNDFSDYLLIPYFNKKCFGAYYIQYVDKCDNPNYKYSYHLDYSKSYEFTKEEHIDNMLGTLNFFNGSYNLVANENRTLYYELHPLTKDFKQYIYKLFNPQSIN